MRQRRARCADEQRSAFKTLGAAEGGQRWADDGTERAAHLLFAHPAAHPETAQRRVEDVRDAILRHHAASVTAPPATVKCRTEGNASRPTSDSVVVTRTWPPSPPASSASRSDRRRRSSSLSTSSSITTGAIPVLRAT